MKILFLDIDGVLNSGNYQTYLIEHELPTHENNCQVFDPSCVYALMKIVAYTQCKIVISSSWRKKGLEAMKKLWKDRDLPGEVIDITPLSNSRIRGEEIEQWLEEYKSMNQEDIIYCIIDDDRDMYPHQPFVKTNGMKGLTDKDADKVIKILGKIDE